jgi:guanylate kinase
MNTGKLVVVSGPSGVGKDTVINVFLKKHPDWSMPESTTTRARRGGEKHKNDMQFISKATFEKWQEEGKFLESVLVDNNQWYGTLRKPVEDLMSRGKNVLLRKDVRGAQIIKDTIPETILVFVVAENWEAIEKRIRARGTEDEESIQRRLALAKTELPYQGKYDFVITNHTNHPEQAVKALTQQIVVNILT